MSAAEPKLPGGRMIFKSWPACPGCSKLAWLVKQPLKPEGDSCVCGNCGGIYLVIRGIALAPKWLERAPKREKVESAPTRNGDLDRTRGLVTADEDIRWE